MAINQAKKPILIFSTTYLPFVGGAEIAVKEITSRLDNFEFDMITAKIKPELAEFERIGNVNIYRVGFGCFLDKYLFPCLAYFKARKLHQEKQYQVVQAIMAFYAGLAALFFKWTYPKVKYLLTMQSGDSDFFIWIRTWFWYPLYRKIYTKPDCVQAISHFLEQRARNYGYQGKAEIIPNGVDIDKFKRQNKQIIKGLKSKLGIRPKEKIILTVSRLVEKNGIDNLIKAGRYLDFPFKIVIAGSGKEEKNLKDLVERKNLKDKVLFLGHINYDDLPEYYSMADVFIRPSRSEGFGNVFLEALACGTPIIGTAAGGSAVQILYERKAGLVLAENPEGISKEIADKIKIALFSDMNMFVKNGQELIQERYTWDIIAKKMGEIFNKLTL